MATATRTPPYTAYAGIMGAFAGLVAAAGALERKVGRDPQCQTALDLAVLGMASFKAARTVARDEVTSFIREPFVRRDPHDGDEAPVPTGDLNQAIGELVTCSRCVGTWMAVGLATTQVLAPRFGRLLTWSLATAGLNDFLQAGFTALTAKANQLEQ